MNTRIWNPETEIMPVRYRVIKNSETIQVGDWITDESTGMADVDGTSEKIAGYVMDIVTQDRVPLASPSVDTGSLGGTWTSSTQQYAAAADNVTVDGVMVKYYPVREGAQFVATLDAAKGTTTGSNVAGYNLAILTSDASLLDESSASTSEASCQFKIVDAYSQGTTTQVIVEVMARESDQYSMD